MDNGLKDLLVKGIEQIDASLISDTLVGRLEKFYNRVELFNPSYKLVSAEGRDLIIKHFLDCLAPVSILNRELSKHHLQVQDLSLQKKPSVPVCFADLGSGCGFPGVILAMVLENSRFSLIERMGRRAGFLRNVSAVMEMSDRVEVVEKTLEDVNCSFDFVTFRAFRQMKDIALHLRRITHSGSVIFAYKSQEENV